MTYEFCLLSLLLVFMLVLFYYSKNDNFSNGNMLFRGIILVTYIIQLCSCSRFLFVGKGWNSIVFSKLYIVLLFLWFMLYGAYYFIKYLKKLLINDKIKRDSLVKKFFIIYWLISFILILINLFSPIDIDNSYFNCGSNLIYYSIILYLLMEAIILVLTFKLYDKKDLISLVIIFILQVMSIIFQYVSPEIPFLIIGMILVVYYNYFSLENVVREEFDNLVLERNYARRQSIDKKDFLKVLSHEIRIPLNTIDGMSQIIMESDNLSEIKNDIEDIRIASRDLIDVINGMIDLSILESGNLEILEENYNIYDMLEDVKNIAASKIKDKNINFNVEISDDIPEILKGDSERFSQVILNLVTNAIKFTEKGNIILKVDSVKSSTKCRLKVIVLDTGKGINKEELNTIFEVKEKENLGLAISKHLLELMGGSIEVESSVGAGSKFSITLDQKIVSDSVNNRGERKRILKPFSAKNKRILLVDDNKLNLKVAMKLIQLYEVEVVEVTSGRECLDVLEKDTNFDLILMDDLMPEMSGTECLNILKKLERIDGFYIPVVVLTANAVSGMREKYISSGFEDYLAKPIDKYELDRILKKFLKK